MHPPDAEKIFEAALQLESEEKRRQYLDLACESDLELRGKIDSMLSAHEEAEAYFHIEGFRKKTQPTNLTPTQLQPAAEKPGTKIGRYKLLQQIGEGGMGIVYMAEQTEPVTRKVALKIIKLGMDTKQVVARFEAERQALAMMDHPHIAKVLDAGATDTGRPFFVMELVRGVPITEYCDKNKLSNATRLELFLPVCQAIQHAHQKGVIHRDIKPSNVMVTLHDGTAVPKVIDFGIAKATHQRLTEKTLFTNYAQMIGTPAYMSPEQAEMSGLDVDTRTDVYSLGVLLYELLTGTTPFPAKELLSRGYGEMQRIISEQEPPKPSTRVKTMQGQERSIVTSNRNLDTHKTGKIIQEDLDCIVMKALEKDRSRRYDTANGLADDIRRFQANETILAHPPNRLYQLRKAWRRNQVPFTAAALVMLALAIGFTLTFFAFRRAVEAQNQERLQRELANENAREAANEKERAETTTQELRETLYLSRVAQALQELEANRPADALELLDACPEELRNWEWHYVHNRCYRSEPETPSPAIEGVTHSLSPTGDLALSKIDQELAIWNLRGDKAQRSSRSLPFFRGMSAFSPDGKLLAQVDHSQNLIHITELSTGKQYPSLIGHTNRIQAIAFHPNGREIATGAEEPIIRIWNLRSGKKVRELTFDTSPTRVSRLAFSRTGKWLAAAYRKSAIKVWNTETWRHQVELPKHSVPIAGLAFSPDETTLVSVDNTDLRIWAIPSGNELGRLTGHKLWVSRVAFSPDGTRLASNGFDRTLKLWDWKKQREALTVSRVSAGFSDLRFTPTGKLLATNWKGALEIHDGSAFSARSSKPDRTLTGHAHRIWALTFSPDGRLFSSAEDSEGFEWDLNLERVENEFKGLFEVATSRDGQYLATAHGRITKVGDQSQFFDQLRVLDAYSLEELAVFNSSRGEFFAAEFSPDGRFLIAGGYARAEDNKRQLFVWDWRNEDKLRNLGTRQAGVIDIEISSDGRHLATANESGKVTLWDAQKLTEPQEGKRIWDQANGFEFFKIDFSPDSSRIAFGDGNYGIAVLDVGSGELALPILEGHGDLVMCVDYSPDGQYLASGGADHTVRLWDARTGEHLRTFLGHEGVVNEVAFSPDSRTLASGGADLDIQLWSIEPSPR